MKRSEILAWFLLGVLVGALIALYLTRPATPPPDCADAREPGAAGDDEREGREPPLNVVEKRPA